MAKKEEKILTHNQVEELGLDKVSVITADMIDGFTHIGEEAFCCCENLTSITIPNSVISIDEEAFRCCENLTSITIPNSVTSIGYSAFGGCTGLTSVTIPNSVTSIGDAAFNSCTGLTSVTIPNSVTKIRLGTFAYCTGLTSVTIPNSVTRIENYAFFICRGLTSMTIPNSVTSIGDAAFNSCSSLTSLTIRDKTYEKQKITNGKCKAYKAFKSDMTCRNFQYEEGKTYKFKGEPVLCKRGFHACLNLIDVFNYYNGKLEKDIIVHEVELDGVSIEMNDDSKAVAKKITIGKRIL